MRRGLVIARFHSFAALAFSSLISIQSWPSLSFFSSSRPLFSSKLEIRRVDIDIGQQVTRQTQQLRNQSINHDANQIPLQRQFPHASLLSLTTNHVVRSHHPSIHDNYSTHHRPRPQRLTLSSSLHPRSFETAF